MKSNKFFLLVISIYSLLAWSWVLLVDATTLTTNTVASNFVRIATILVNAGLSIYIYYKFFVYLNNDLNKQKKPYWKFLIKLFFLWAFAEWFVAWATAMIWFGSGATYTTVHPFVSLTPLLSYTPIVFAARLVGFYGLSALLGCFIVSVYSEKLRRYSIYIGLIFLLITGLSFLAWRNPSGPTYEIATLAQHLGETPNITTDSDLLVVPEYGLDDYENTSVNRIKSNSTKEVFFIGSKQTPGPNGLSNTMLLGATKQDIIDQQDKTRLVAGSEYLPFFVEAGLNITRQTGTLAEFQVVRAVEKGNQKIRPLVINEDLIVGAEVCSSIISTEDYRSLTKQGATILTNSASLGVFGGSTIYRTLHNGMARFHAVANARVFVQSAQDENAYILDHQGKQIATAEPTSQVSTNIDTNNRLTLYSVIGEWPVYVGGVYFVYIVFDYLRRKLKTNKNAHVKIKA